MKLFENLIILMLMVCFFIAGASSAIYFGFNFMPMSFGLHPALELLIMTLAFFVCGILFFGYLAPALMFFLGIINGQALMYNPLVAIAYIVPIFLATFLGSKTGMLLKTDMDGRGNIRDAKMFILGGLGISLVIAIALGFAVPML